MGREEAEELARQGVPILELNGHFIQGERIPLIRPRASRLAAGSSRADRQSVSVRVFKGTFTLDGPCVWLSDKSDDDDPTPFIVENP